MGHARAERGCQVTGGAILSVAADRPGCGSCADLRRELALLQERYRELVAQHTAEEAAWQVERQELLTRIADLEAALAAERGGRTAEAEQSASWIAQLVGQLKDHARARFGRKTERVVPVAREATGTARPRGQQRGSPGHGRCLTRYDTLPEEHRFYDLSEAEQRCARCGTDLERVGEQCSVQLEIRVDAHRVVYHQAVYVERCPCEGARRFHPAPAPVKLIPRGLLTSDTIALLLVAKYLWGMPLHRITTALGQLGVPLPDSTVVGSFAQVQPLIARLAEAIRMRNRLGPWLHVDETTWRKLWVVRGRRGWLWVFVGPDTTVYLYDDGRDHTVLLRYLGLAADQPAVGETIQVFCDFLASYDKACQVANTRERRLELLRCWVHYRRLFLKVRDRCPRDAQVQQAVQAWLEMIADLFALHHERDLAPDGSEAQDLAQQAFAGCLEEMADVRARQLARVRLAPELRHALEYGQAHWDELVACAGDPHAAPDNNAAERAARLIVVGRKNFYGSGAPWSLEQATDLWTLGATALQNGQNPLALIQGYFTACAVAGGQAVDPTPYLPWALPNEPQAEPPHDAAPEKDPSPATEPPEPAPAGTGDVALLTPPAIPRLSPSDPTTAADWRSAEPHNPGSPLVGTAPVPEGLPAIAVAAPAETPLAAASRDRARDADAPAGTTGVRGRLARTPGIPHRPTTGPGPHPDRQAAEQSTAWPRRSRRPRARAGCTPALHVRDPA